MGDLLALGLALPPSLPLPLSVCWFLFRELKRKLFSSAIPQNSVLLESLKSGVKNYSGFDIEEVN